MSQLLGSLGLLILDQCKLRVTDMVFLHGKKFRLAVETSRWCQFWGLWSKQLAIFHHPQGGGIGNTMYLRLDWKLESGLMCMLFTRGRGTTVSCALVSHTAGVAVDLPG